MKREILEIMHNNSKKSFERHTILRKLDLSEPTQISEFNSAFDELVQMGEIIKRRTKYISAETLGMTAAKIIRLSDSFGFAKNELSEREYFLPGRHMKGAMPGDIVLLKMNNEQFGEKPEAKVDSIIIYENKPFVGSFARGEGYADVIPDGLAKIRFRVTRESSFSCTDGIRVMAQIVSRGNSHFDHRVKIIKAYGEAQNAAVCAKSILDLEGVCENFDNDAENSALRIQENGIPKDELENRIDLTSKKIFTIDGIDAKDLDDAVNVEKTNDGGFILGVHIADVSHYIRHKSLLDREAFARGTSIYYADKVVPMFPKAISNGICSLTPHEIRLTFSCFINLDKSGKIISYEFQKSYINSRIKGVYEEINQILDETASPEILGKYQDLLSEIQIMAELAEILRERRKSRGALDLEAAESKIITDENGIAIDVIPRTQGVAENIIEEFMLTANEAAATYALSVDIPFVYRVHEKPSEDKIKTLAKTLALLGVNTRTLNGEIQTYDLTKILNSVKGTDIERIVNTQLLRSLAKAKYYDQNKGHFGLMLDNYTHFTSPIRRYPDLTIHRILTDLVSGQLTELSDKYGTFVKESAMQSTLCEIKAMKIERTCEDIYKAEYMSNHIGEEFHGIISSCASHGVYVELPNTIEGLCKIVNLPEGSYWLDDTMRLVDSLTNCVYSVGDKVEIKVIAADISSGMIDFELLTKPHKIASK